MATTLNNSGIVFPDATTQTTAATSGGDYVLRAYTSPATWTKPAGLKSVKVTVIGAGGEGGNIPPTIYGINGGSGAGGGGAIKYVSAPVAPSSVSVTVGSGGSKTSSFGAFCSATGGVKGNNAPSPGLSAPSAIVAGGVGTGGDLNAPGQETAGGSAGGTSAFGYGIGARTFSRPTSSPGVQGTGYGAGSSGAKGPGGRTGVDGTPGVVIVEEFY